jgi:hypothetical protein
MSGKRIIRFFIGLVIALVILPIGLPLVGVPKSHFLPPMWVYAQAKGTTQGQIINYRYSLSNNPFMVGTKLFFMKYQFRAKPPVGDTRKMQMYYGEAQVPQEIYHNVNVGDVCPIRYEQTFPELNGIDTTTVGQGCNGPNNVLGPWLVWPALAIFLAIVFMLILDRVGAKEDI